MNINTFSGLDRLMKEGVLKVKEEVEKRGEVFDVNLFSKTLVSEAFSILVEYGKDMQKYINGKMEDYECRVYDKISGFDSRINVGVQEAKRYYNSAKNEVDNFGKHLEKMEINISNEIVKVSTEGLETVKKESEVVLSEIKDFVNMGNELKEQLEVLKKSFREEILEHRTWVNNNVEKFNSSIIEKEKMMEKMIEEEIKSFMIKNIIGLILASIWTNIKMIFGAKRVNV